MAWNWVRRFFNGFAAPRVGGGTAVLDRPRPAVRTAPPVESESPPAAGEFPAPRGGIGNLDKHGAEAVRITPHTLLVQLGERVKGGKLDLPQLPSSSLIVLDLTSKASVSAHTMTQAIEGDPVLSSELLRTANSALFGGDRPAQTVQQAVVRLGTRNLRTLVLGLSMRSVLTRVGGVADYAKEVWRQATSVARLARMIAGETGRDPDTAFLIGLLHDIGKVPLLDQIGRLARTRMDVTTALIGDAFSIHHEHVGALIASEWRLPDEVVEVARCHHDYHANERFPDSAALVTFAHKMDLHLSLGGEEDYWQLHGAPEIQQLAMPSPQARSVLKRGLAEFKRTSEGGDAHS